MAVEALDFLESHLEESISVQEVTKVFEKSHWHFQRMFRSIVGLSMGQYLRFRRMTQAAVLLKETQLRILDIAIRFDFSSQEAFSRAFKQHFSISPREYRKNKEFVLREAQNRITHEKLEYFWHSVQRTPQIETLEEKTLVGTQVDFVSHFSEGTDCAQKVLPHWLEFLKLKKTILNAVGEKLYGVALTSEEQLRKRSLTYLSAVEVSHPEHIPAQMSSIVLPGGLYACFQNRGLAQKHSNLIDYVYGIWLPSSGYQRGFGYDFEVFDHRYNQNNPTSVSKLFIPIVK